MAREMPARSAISFRAQTMQNSGVARRGSTEQLGVLADEREDGKIAGERYEAYWGTLGARLREMP
jgi:hypothetical protein